MIFWGVTETKKSKMAGQNGDYCKIMRQFPRCMTPSSFVDVKRNSFEILKILNCLSGEQNEMSYWKQNDQENVDCILSSLRFNILPLSVDLCPWNHTCSNELGRLPEQKKIT